jgi:hypothetical protein
VAFVRMVEDWGLTVEVDVGLAFAFLPVCTPFELDWTWRAGGRSERAAGEERGKNCDFGEHGDSLEGNCRD